MFKTLKENLYFLKVWYKDIFRYPRASIVVDESLDYDRYWEIKRRNGEVGHLSDWQEARAQLVVDTIKRVSYDRAVSIGDIGCGEGSILKYIGDRVSVAHAVGYDSSEHVLEKARAIAITTVKLDLTSDQDLEFIKEADYTLLLEVLEHLPNSEKILRAAYQKSRQGVFFSFPNTGFFVYRLRLLFGRFPKQWINLPNEHLRYWTVTDLKWWLKAQGYSSYELHCYKGVRWLNNIWPSLFAGGQLVYLKK